MSNDEVQRELSYYDILMADKKPHMSTANLAECLACHGVSTDKGQDGIRTILEPRFAWSRVVGGVH
jgi:hypothetical protein